jgi:hypothetical protein
MVFQSIEMGGPELPVRGQPLVQLGQRLRPDAIQAPLGVGAGFYKSGVLENAEVLRDGRLTEAEAADELADGALAVAKQLEDGDPSGLGESRKRSELAHIDKYAKLVICLSTDIMLPR